MQHRLANSSSPALLSSTLLASPPCPVGPSALPPPQGSELLRDLLAVQVPITLNLAFCEFQASHCPPSEQLVAECGKVRAGGGVGMGWRAGEGGARRGGRRGREKEVSKIKAWMCGGWVAGWHWSKA